MADHVKNKIASYKPTVISINKQGIWRQLIWRQAKRAREKRQIYKNAHFWLELANPIWKRLIGARKTLLV